MLYAALFWVTAGMSCIEFAASPKVSAVNFLPDDAEVACRAILPQCFKRSAWAELCASDRSVAEGHPEACRAAGFEPSIAPQGR